MPKHVIHISELKAAQRFATLLARLGAGEEIVIEDDSRPVAVVHPAEPSVRLLSESLRLAREHGSTVTLDGDFGKDVEAGIASHQEPLEPPAWD
jgi:antitoxin (DNA-binding transcriptional repressor) of toxin-antitoxin stability system